MRPKSDETDFKKYSFRKKIAILCSSAVSLNVRGCSEAGRFQQYQNGVLSVGFYSGLKKINSSGATSGL